MTSELLHSGLSMDKYSAKNELFIKLIYASKLEKFIGLCQSSNTRLSNITKVQDLLINFHWKYLVQLHMAILMSVFIQFTTISVFIQFTMISVFIQFTENIYPSRFWVKRYLVHRDRDIRIVYVKSEFRVPGINRKMDF